MAVLSKGQTFADGDDVTHTKLNNLVDAATFVSGSSGTTDDSSLEVNGSGRLQVKASGVTTGKIAASAVTTAKIANSTATTDGITFPKMRYLSDMTVIGNVSGGETTPSEVTILDEDNMVSDSATSLATQQSIKAYVDSFRSTDDAVATGSTMATSGSVTLPGGIIMKFGVFELSSDGTVTLTFPTAFPTSCYAVVANLHSGNEVGAVLTTNLTASGFNANRNDAINGTSTHNFIAIGS